MIHELNHFGIVVRDLERSMSFYSDAFSARTVFEGFIPASGTDVRYLQLGGGLIELLHQQDAPPDTSFGVTHIAFMTDDLDADYDRLLDAGATDLVRPRPAGSGVGRLAFLGDPNGARVELLQRDVKMREGIVEDDHVVGFDHYSLHADDLGAARHFYVDLLGMRNLRTIDAAAQELTIDYLHYDDDVLELMHRPEPATGSIYAHIALRVLDLDGLLEKLGALGIRPKPSTPRPAGSGYGRIAVVTDPDGLDIELLDRPELKDLPVA